MHVIHAATSANVEGLLNLVTLVKTEGIEQVLQQVKDAAYATEVSKAEAETKLAEAVAAQKAAEDLRREAHATMAEAVAAKAEADRMGEAARIAHKNAKAMEKEADEILNRARAHAQTLEQEYKVRQAALVEREQRVGDAIKEAEIAKHEYEQKLSSLRAAVN